MDRHLDDRPAGDGTAADALPLWLQECLREPDLPENQKIAKAYRLAHDRHAGQFRASGEPYIMHPVQVATILRDLGGDRATVAAGFLHDIIEDTEITGDDLEAWFGVEVRTLVEGVTKLSKFNFESKTERQAENFRRMFLAMAQDIRVIVVKLADRLHNMRTLEHLKSEKQGLIARETMEIFAPLANRLGIGQIKWELEDLSFKYLEPDAYREMQSLVADTRRNREALVERVVAELREHLGAVGMQNFEVGGRPKHLYGIYNKMQRQQKPYHEIFDILAVRTIVETAPECYRVLAVVHDRFRPIPGRFKDYIGLPKPNRYQSLHTAVVGPQGQPLEVQIRTWEMHHIAEYGIAAHWKYKETRSSDFGRDRDDEKFSWLRQLVEWQKEVKDDREYIESLKDNFFDTEVYVFSPKGDVYCLPAGATPVDFAYRIHTEVGNHCAGAMVNHRIVPLDRLLQNGDIVEILTQKNAHPHYDWIQFAATGTAKNRVRQWFKKERREEHIAQGRAALEKEMGKAGFENLLKSERMAQVVERSNLHSVEDLLAAIGYGELSAIAMAHRLRDEERSEPPLKLPTYAVTPVTVSKAPILGIEGAAHHLAGCCRPLPGDEIVGIVPLSGHRSIAIHRQDCPNAAAIEEGRRLAVRWNPNPTGHNRPMTYPVDLRVEVLDRVGVLRDILNRLSERRINVRGATVKTAPNQSASIALSLDISDRPQFEAVVRQLSQMGDVLVVQRTIPEVPVHS
ncbi:MAG: bifunctional (p)ppGpp synthetase/guanosine-3',5'-bis(diphosphate) 3'-pyrophosphohydrolase [Oscillatoriales cyanobacterium SM2_1_8]|nr:bifunctional (p)ppGpp synthetase/guanosine-3',5'-bis(diphosphate) 3'-pyrophosphohydrolase [Oscillatoriales cyanobacterium SM2_1_8]